MLFLLYASPKTEGKYDSQAVPVKIPNSHASHRPQQVYVLSGSYSFTYKVDSDEVVTSSAINLTFKRIDDKTLERPDGTPGRSSKKNRFHGGQHGSSYSNHRFAD